MWNNVPLVVTVIVVILGGIALVTRFGKDKAPTKPCPECGAKKVPCAVYPDGDYEVEVLYEHTPGKNKLVEVFPLCTRSGNQTRRLRPRYCAAAVEGCPPLPLGRFVDKPPYVALHHDSAHCRGSLKSEYVECEGSGRPTSLEPRKRLSAAA